jgi:non-canonical poly(A) RNA polymerase PAPD5/7
MPLDGPSSSRNTISTGYNDSESRGKGAATGLANGSTTMAKSRRNKGKGSRTATPLLDEEKLPTTFEESSFEDNVDFIAFEPELHERDSKGEQEGQRAGEQDRDAMKSRERDGEDSKKRKLDYDQNDGYNNKRERTNAASRKAPWVTDVDWEGSTNVAELYVFSLSSCIITDGSSDYIERLMPL